MMYSKLAVAALLAFGQVSAMNTHGWTKMHKADENELVRVIFPIKQNNLDMLEKLFWEISNPKSSMYGEFLSYDEIGNLVKNDLATLTAVEWFKAVGIAEEHIWINPYGTIVSSHLPISVLNQQFNADFHVYSHPKFGGSIVKTERITLPTELQGFVTHIPHVSYFPSNKKLMTRSFNGKKQQHRDFRAKLAKRPVNANGPPTADGLVHPSTLAWAYGINNMKVSNGATQSVFEALGQSYSDGDLGQFFKQENIPRSNITKVIGPNNPWSCWFNPDNCGEANLDVQFIMGVAQGAATTYWSIDENSNDPFFDWIEALGSTADPPQVHSISYGGDETEEDPQNAAAFNTQAQKLGAMGVSIMVSSGDDGVASADARDNKTACGYMPSFPASSPYVTAVGATQGPESGKTEVGCSSQTGSLITSGGGFSIAFPQPSYQADAVNAFLKTTTAAAGYNAKGRAYPDVSALGHNYAVVIDYMTLPVDGTSASSPVFAAMITLINDARLGAGKKPLGFLNPALYQTNAADWNDITSGSNNCAAQNWPQVCCKQGFTATKGWDPVTGLGSPNFAKLSKDLEAL